MVGLFLFGAFSFPIVFGAPPVRLFSDGVCPSEVRIGAELEAIVRSREGAPVDVARVTTQDGEILVTLKDAEGALLGERRLRAEGDCDAQARAVAVILATFLADRHPEYLTLLPAAPDSAPDEPSEPVSAPPAAPAPAPAQVEPAPEPPKGAPVRAPEAAALPTPAKAPVPELAFPRDEWLLAAAVGGELSSEVVPAGAVSLSFIPGARGFGGRVFVLVAGSAERALGEERASYSRYPLGVGPLFRVGHANAWFDAAAGVAFAWLRVAGRTFASNSSADDVVVGPFLSVRAGSEAFGLRPFVEVGVLGWPGESVLISRSPAESARLPRFEATVLLGAGLPL